MMGAACLGLVKIGKVVGSCHFSSAAITVDDSWTSSNLRAHRSSQSDWSLPGCQCCYVPDWGLFVVCTVELHATWPSCHFPITLSFTLQRCFSSSSWLHGGTCHGGTSITHEAAYDTHSETRHNYLFILTGKTKTWTQRLFLLYSQNMYLTTSASGVLLVSISIYIMQHPWVLFFLTIVFK